MNFLFIHATSLAARHAPLLTAFSLVLLTSPSLAAPALLASASAKARAYAQDYLAENNLHGLAISVGNSNRLIWSEGSG